MRRTRRLLLTSLLVAMALQAAAADDGRVVLADERTGLGGVAVTLTLPAGYAGPSTITVFTDPDGRYRFPDGTPVSAAGATLAAQHLGYAQQTPTEGAAGTLVLAPIDNLAPQAPASAWLALTPAGDERNVLLTSCTSCHQMPSPKVLEYAAQIDAVRGGPDGDSVALEAWRKLVRHEAWRTIVEYMRTQHYAVFPDESAMNLDAIDWATALNPDFNFFNAQQGERVARYLAEHFPRDTTRMARSTYAYGAPLGVTPHTVIREYALPDDALVREMVPVPGSPFLWGVDVKRNEIVRLEPSTGAVRWFRVSFPGATGPHTIAPDDQGRLWISMIDNDQFGSFDPVTEQWTLWTLRPTGLPDTAAMGGAAIVHDLSIDSRGHMEQDADGRIWLTMVGTNQLGTLAPASGEVAFYDTNTLPGLSPINHLIYSVVLSDARDCAWYSQVNGAVGCLDTTTMQRRHLVDFPEGQGPRRMMRDNAGNLWVALFGSGQVARIRMQDGVRTATYDLPDRASAPYAVTWDERRQCVWVVTANSDALYRVDAATGASRVYPLPRRMAYLRQVGLDQASGRLVASYGNYPAGSGPSYAVLIDVGD